MLKQLTRLSVKARLIIAFAVILFVPSITITVISYTNTEQQIATKQLESAHESIKLLNDNLTATLQPKIDQVDFLANYITGEQTQNDEAHVHSLLREYLAMHSDVAIAYVGTADKKMIRQPYYQYDSSYDPTERPWYVEASKNSNKTIITAPYISTSSGELVVTIARQLQDKSAVIGMDVSLQTIVDIANNVKIGQNGFVTVVDEMNHFIASPNAESGAVAEDSYIEKLTTNGDTDVFGNFTILYEENSFTGWKLYGHMANAEAGDAAKVALYKTLMVVLVCVIVFVMLSYYIIVSILRPIRLLKEAATEISEGNLATTIPEMGSNEIGQLQTQFSIMRKNLTHLIEQVEASTQNVQQSTTSLSKHANETTNASELASASVQQIAATLDTQMSANEQNVQTMEQMEQRMVVVNNNSTEIANLAQQALTTAATGTQSVERTVTQMNSIAGSVTAADENVRALSSRIDEIDSIVEVISSIANQTNLLALNASIEAARAGEHGKGFAVVAQEVSKLADSSQASAKQISDLIVSIQHDTNQSVQYMNSVKDNVSDGLTVTEETAGHFSQIVTSLEQITPMINDISTNTEEMVAATIQATAAANEIAQQSQENTAAVEEIVAITEQIHHSMREIDEATEGLQQMSNTLHAEIQRFTK